MARSIFKTEGIKLREYLYRESDAILQIFTRDRGTLKAVAPGMKKSRKRFPGSIRKLCFYEFNFSQGKREFPIVNSARFIDGYDDIGRDFKNYCTADYILQVIQYFYPENVSSPFIYDSLKIFLDALRVADDFLSPLKWMEIRILSDSGFMSKFTRCSQCDSLLRDTDRLYYNIRTGQNICGSCEKKGLFTIINNKIKTNINMALNIGCDEYRITSHKDTDLYNKITTNVIVEKLGFFPKVLVELYGLDHRYR